MNDLPTLPQSRPQSPYEKTPRGPLLLNDLSLDSLPALPRSRAASPYEENAQGSLLTEDQLADEMPALPRSRPDSPYEETPQRPQLQPRFSSSTAVPLRFRRPPGSPATRESLVSSPVASSPASPELLQRRGSRPHSGDFSKHGNEFRPLYLLERTRKTPEPEEPEQLPSLPSSRTTSRASSVHDSDDYQSAQESPVETRFDDAVQSQGDYGIDAPLDRMARDQQMQTYEAQDFLDSQETTPTGPSFPAEVMTPREDLADDEARWLENTRRMQEEAEQTRARSKSQSHALRDATAAAVTGGVGAAISHQMISAAAEHSALESPNRETHQRNVPVQEPASEMREDDPFTWEEIKADDQPDVDQHSGMTAESSRAAAIPSQSIEPSTTSIGIETKSQPNVEHQVSTLQSQDINQTREVLPVTDEGANVPALTEPEPVSTSENGDKGKKRKQILVIDTGDHSIEPPVPSIEVEPATAITADETPESVTSIPTPPVTVIPERDSAVKDEDHKPSIDTFDSDLQSHETEDRVTAEPTTTIHHENVPASLSLGELPTPLPTDTQAPITPQTPATAGKDGVDPSFEDMQALTRTRSRKSVSWPDDKAPSTPERPVLTREESGLVKWVDPPKHDYGDTEGDVEVQVKKGKKGKKTKKGRKLSLGDEEPTVSEISGEGGAEFVPENIPLPSGDDEELIEPATKLALAREVLQEQQTTQIPPQQAEEAANLDKQDQAVPTFRDPFAPENIPDHASETPDFESKDIAPEVEEPRPGLTEPAPDELGLWALPSGKKKKSKKNSKSGREALALGAVGAIAGAAFGALASKDEAERLVQHSPSSPSLNESPMEKSGELKDTLSVSGEPSPSQTSVQAAPDEEWALPSTSKKGKKAKKGKRISNTFSSEPEPTEDAATEPTAVETPVAESKSVRQVEPSSENVETTTSKEVAFEPETSGQEVTQDDLWGSVSTKKSKKGKKGKKSSFGSPVKESEISEASPNMVSEPNASIIGPESARSFDKVAEGPMSQETVHIPESSEKPLENNMQPTGDLGSSTAVEPAEVGVEKSVPALLSEPGLSEKILVEPEGDVNTANTQAQLTEDSQSERPTSGAKASEHATHGEVQDEGLLSTSARPEESEISSALITPLPESGRTSPLEMFQDIRSVPESATQMEIEDELSSTLPVNAKENEMSSALTTPLPESGRSSPLKSSWDIGSELEPELGPAEETTSEEPVIASVASASIAESSQPDIEPISQATPVDQENDWPAYSSSKRTKKGKKGRKASVPFESVDREVSTEQRPEGSSGSLQEVLQLSKEGQDDSVSRDPEESTALQGVNEPNQSEIVTPRPIDTAKEDGFDEFSFVASSKKKKGKKAKRGSIPAAPSNEPELGEISLAEPITRVGDATTELAEEQPGLAQSSDEPTVADLEGSQQATGGTQEVDNEDIFPMKVTKKGKKGKKGKKNSEPSTPANESETQFIEATAPLDEPTPEQPIVEGAQSQTPSLDTVVDSPSPEKHPVSEPLVELSREVDPALVEETQITPSETAAYADIKLAGTNPLTANESSPPEEEWASSFSSKKSKKGKKGKRASLASTPQSEPAEELQTPIAIEGNEDTIVGGPRAENMLENAANEPTAVDELPRESIGEADEMSKEVATEEWASPFSSKKSKKGKKGKRASIASTPQSEAAEEPEMIAVTEEQKDMAVEERLASDVLASAVSEYPSAGGSLQETVGDGDEEPKEAGPEDWTSSFSSKKSKKGKNGKRTSIASTPQSEAAEEPEMIVPSEEQKDIVAEERLDPDILIPTTNEPPNVTVPLQQPSGDGSEEPKEAGSEDWAASFSSKKSKKGKKGKRASIASTPQSEPAEETQEIVTTEPDTGIASEELPTAEVSHWTVNEPAVDTASSRELVGETGETFEGPGPEEFWSSSSKKGKKGKKGKKSLPSTSSEPVESQTTFGVEDVPIAASEDIQLGQPVADPTASPAHEVMKSEPIVEPSLSATETERPEYPAEDDTFTYSAPKKGKKGKKGKRGSGASTPAAEIEPVLSVGDRSTERDEDRQLREPVAEESTRRAEEPILQVGDLASQAEESVLQTSKFVPQTEEMVHQEDEMVSHGEEPVSQVEHPTAHIEQSVPDAGESISRVEPVPQEAQPVTPESQQDSLVVHSLVSGGNAKAMEMETKEGPNVAPGTDQESVSQSAPKQSVKPFEDESSQETHAQELGGERGPAVDTTTEPTSQVRTDDVWDDTELLSQERRDAPQDAQEDDFWDPQPLPKLGKKGKKGKRASLPSTPTGPDESMSREVELAQGPTASASNPLSEQEMGDVQQEPQEDSFWDPPPKRGKKGKKGKRTSIPSAPDAQDGLVPWGTGAAQETNVLPLKAQSEQQVEAEPNIQSDIEHPQGQIESLSNAESRDFNGPAENAQVLEPVSRTDKFKEPSMQEGQPVEQSVEPSTREEQPDEPPGGPSQSPVASHEDATVSLDDFVRSDKLAELGRSLDSPVAPVTTEFHDEAGNEEGTSQAKQSSDTATSGENQSQDAGINVASQPLLTEPEEKLAMESESSSFQEASAKKTKKAKKKGKMSLSKLAIKYPSASAEELESMLREQNEGEGTTSTHETSAERPKDTEEIAETTTLEKTNADEPNLDHPQTTEAINDDEFAVPSSKKSKKQKKREKEARKASLPFGESGSARVPSAAVGEQMPSYFEQKPAEDEVSHNPPEDLSRDNIAQSLRDHGVNVASNERQKAADTSPQGSERALSSHDIDFAATVAAGLQDSGFDPNLAVNDPSFHRRSSPPNVGPEADPEEVAPPSSKRVKDGCRSPSPPKKFSADTSGSVGEDRIESSENKTFDDVVTAGLSSAGFDTTIAYAQTSGHPQPEQEDFFPFKTSKKKGKKGKKSGTATPQSSSEPTASAKSRDLAESPVVTPIDMASNDANPVSTSAPETPQQETDDFFSYQPKKKGKKSKKRSSLQTSETPNPEDSSQFPEETSDIKYLDSFTDPSTAVSSEVHQIMHTETDQQENPPSLYDGHDYNYDLPADPITSVPSRQSREKEVALAQLTNELERRRKESMTASSRSDSRDAQEVRRDVKEEPSSTSTPAEPEDAWSVPTKKSKKEKKGKRSKSEDVGLLGNQSSEGGFVAAGLVAGAVATAAAISGSQDKTSQHIETPAEPVQPLSSMDMGEVDASSSNAWEPQVPTSNIEREKLVDSDPHIQHDQQRFQEPIGDWQEPSAQDIRGQEQELFDAADRAQQGNPGGQYVTSAPAEVEPIFNEDIQEFSEARHKVDDDMAWVQTAPVQPERWEDVTPTPESVSGHRESEPESCRRENLPEPTINEPYDPQDEEMPNLSGKQSKKGKKSRRREGLQPIRTDTESLMTEQAQQREAEDREIQEAPIPAVEHDPPPRIWVEPASTDRPQLVPRTTTGSEEMGALMIAPVQVEDVAVEQSVKHSASQDQLDSPIPKEHLKDMAEDDGEFTRVKKGKKKKGKKSEPTTPSNEPGSPAVSGPPVVEDAAIAAQAPRDLNVPPEETPLAPIVAEAEDEWATSKKKSKKGKKAKKGKELPESALPESESFKDIAQEEQIANEQSSLRTGDILPAVETQADTTTVAHDDSQTIVMGGESGKKKGKKRPEPPTPAHAPEDIRDGKMFKDRHSELVRPQSPDISSPTSSSKVGSVFPHLQRVKRRTPSMDTTEQSRESNLPPEHENKTLSADTSEQREELHVSRENEVEARRSSPAAPQATWGFPNRDSGFGTESPIIYQEPKTDHNATRDSGYQGTPIESRYNRSSMGGQTDITEIEDEPSPDYESSGASEKMNNEQRRAGPEQIEARTLPLHSGTNTRSGDPLRVSVEVDPEWELSVSKQRASTGTSANGSELSPIRQPAGVERELHRQDVTEHVPPSPVDSSSKQRSSYLFNTPPRVGTKESKDSTPHNRNHPDEIIQGKESPVAPTKGRKRRQATEGQADSSGAGIATGVLAGVGAAAAVAAAHSSSEHDNPANFEQPSAYDTPVAQSRSGGHLEPIEEHSPEDSHLNKRAMSDSGSPDRSTKSARRSKTPQQDFREQWMSPTRDAEHKKSSLDASRDEARSSTPLSTDELIDRLSWPPVDEDRETVGIDRVLSGSHSKTLRPGSEDISPKSHASASSIARIKSPTERIRSPGSFSNSSWRSDTTPPLRRSSRQLSGDLRAKSRLDEDKERQRTSAEQSSEAATVDPPRLAPYQYDRAKHKGKARATDMSDVYVSSIEYLTNIIYNTDDLLTQEGTGAHPGSPMSPTRPPSIRKRQSLHIIDLEQRLDQLSSENRNLQDARAKAEEAAREYTYRRDVSAHAVAEAVQKKDLELREKDAEIQSMNELLANVRAQVASLSEINEGLARTKAVYPELEEQHRSLQEEHTNTQQQWQQDREELANLRDQHAYINTNMEGIMRNEITRGLEDKEAEIHRLREELQLATQQIRSLQQQILDTKASSSDWLTVSDEDYFDTACQELCAHVQSWIKRFSKWSDHTPCRLSRDLQDDKLEARLDNAILDGSDVDALLADRTRRRDVFMSLVMTMIWEYVFTRYLFGMDRDQRQKLKQLEKTLSDVGPARAVAHWRATTLALLARRPQFALQKQQDTQAVAATVFDTLASLLPPPPERERELRDSLLKVVALAVELAIQMRCQRAEYIMLPPLQPEYDANGDLSRKVTFNAALMNERSGDTPSRSSMTAVAGPLAEGNDALEARKAVVKIVLFPLVVKKGDDEGEGEDEIVVCPAQVLVAKEKGKRVVRVQSGAMDVDDAKSARSVRTRGSGTYSQFEGEGGMI